MPSSATTDPRIVRHRAEHRDDRRNRSPNLASRFDFWPVVTAEGQNAVIGLAFDPDERPSAPDVLVNIVVRVLALVLDR
jgi:hypothetical protein